MLVDSHCHCYEFGEDELRKFAEKYKLVSVSEDYQSAKRVLELSGEIGVLPCIGLHPWNVGKAEPEELSLVLKLIDKSEAPCIGEVGLDRKFVPNTWYKQLEYFKRFLEAAREYDLVVNVHAPDAWREAADLLRRYDVNRALIHWYTGPLDLLEDLDNWGYFITINPAIVIQRRQQEVALHAPRRIVLIESDGPYEYRGLNLTPEAMEKAVEKLSELWGQSREDVEDILYINSSRIWRL